MISAQSLAAISVCMVLGFAIPIAAIIIYKKRNRDAWLPSAFIGAAAITVFALIQLILLILLVRLFPLIARAPSAIIMAVMAGVFEETARLVVYKTLMKNRLSTKNAVMMGLGFGGIEMIEALGLTFLMHLIMAITANSNRVEATLIVVEETRFKDILLPIIMRVIGMTFHVCLSVWVYKAVTHKMWLYPAAIAAHTVYDGIASLDTMVVIKSPLLVEAILTAITAAAVFATIKLTKKFPDNVS